MGSLKYYNMYIILTHSNGIRCIYIYIIYERWVHTYCIIYNIDSEQIIAMTFNAYTLEQRGGDPSLKEYLQSIITINR